MCALGNMLSFMICPDMLIARDVGRWMRPANDGEVASPSLRLPHFR